MASEKQPQILAASSALLGISFVLITGLKLSNAAENTLADEISLFSAACFFGGCLVSYLAIRTEKEAKRIEMIADYMFLTGLITLFVAMAAFSTELF